MRSDDKSAFGRRAGETGGVILKKTLTEENVQDGWNGDACVDVFDSDRWNDGHVECFMAPDYA